MNALPSFDGAAPPTAHRSDEIGCTKPMPHAHEMHAIAAPPNPSSPIHLPTALPRNGHEPCADRCAQAVLHPSAGSTQAGQIDGTTVTSFEGERLAILAGKLGARLAGWKWLPAYNRWRSGESVGVFQRKMLAIMLARLRNTALDWEECARAKALPERKRS